jgi:hypothetical protein
VPLSGPAGNRERGGVQELVANPLVLADDDHLGLQQRR